MNEILCPFCKGDYLIHGRIDVLKIRGYVCPECSAFWKEDVERIAKNHQFFQDFMKNQGLDADWKYLEKIDE